MTDKERFDIIERAEMVVDGYAFIKGSKIEDSLTVVSLNKPFHAVLFRADGEVLETNMPDVELSIVKKYWQRNKTLMEEVAHA